MSAAEEAYAKAIELIESTARTGAATLFFSDPVFRALDRIPPEIGGLDQVEAINLSHTDVSDLRPLQTMAQLTALNLDGTRVTDLRPLYEHVRLKHLSLNDTQVSDLFGITNMPLRTLRLARSAVADLRLLRDEMDGIGTGEDSDFSFEGCLATKLDPNLDLLSKIRWPKRRSEETRIYLAGLPAFPTALPWLNGGEAPPLTAMKGWLPEEIYPASAETSPRPVDWHPSNDPALPMHISEQGVTLSSSSLSPEDQADAIRPALHEILRGQAQDLVRIAGNLDDAAWSGGCKLRDLLEAPFEKMDPLRVHLAVEALRRTRRALPENTDFDLINALDAIVETAPGLTLDTAPIKLLLDRIQRNRLEAADAARVEAEILVTRAIAEQGTTAEDLQVIAKLASAPDRTDQFTYLRPTLNKNYVATLGKYLTIAGTFVAGTAVGGVIGNRADDLVLQGWNWLNANHAELRILANYWGEPFLAWLLPILEKASQIQAGAQHLLR